VHNYLRQFVYTQTGRQTLTHMDITANLIISSNSLRLIGGDNNVLLSHCCKQSRQRECVSSAVYYRTYYCDSMVKRYFIVCPFVRLQLLGPKN